MQKFTRSIILLALVSIQCSCYSRIPQLGNWIKNKNSSTYNQLDCLKTLIAVQPWAVDYFLAILDEPDTVRDGFFKLYTNFSWELHSDTNKNRNLTGASNVIIFTSNFDTLNKTLMTINIKRTDIQAKHVIVLSKNFEDLKEIRTASVGIPALMWALDKTQIVFLVPCKEEVFVMTYFPFILNCQVGELEILDIWQPKSFYRNAKFFQTTMSDIHGCVINHTAISPLGTELQAHRELTETGEETLGGVGGKLIYIIAEKMNMKLRLSSEDIEHFLTIMEKIARDESLFWISGSIPYVWQLKRFEIISGYMQEALAFGYITGGFEISWKNLVWPFPIEVWRFAGCIFLIFNGVIFLTKLSHRRKISPGELRLLDVFGIFIGVSQILPRTNFVRYLFGIWMFYSFVISASYNCGLISFLTQPNEKRIINTFEDLLEDGMSFGGSSYYRALYQDPSDPIMTKVYNNFKIWPLDESFRILSTGEGATGVFTSTMYMYNIEHPDPNSQLRMLTQSALTYQVPINMRRGSPFINEVRRHMFRALQGGLNNYWFDRYTWKPISSTVDIKSPIRISMLHLKGILTLYFAGSIFSFIIFVGEFIFHKYL